LEAWAPNHGGGGPARPESVHREFYREVLGHSPGSVDLTRLNDALPFLVNHNPNDQVGVIERAWLDPDRVVRCRVRMSASTRAEEIFQDILTGIRKHVSVGYEHTQELGSTRDADGIETIRFAWAPYEASIVPIPADPTVGVGRGFGLA
jgi:hypothetical protein